MKFKETVIDKFWEQLRTEVKDANDRIDVLLGCIAIEFEFLSEYNPDSEEAINYILGRYRAKCERINKLTK